MSIRKHGTRWQVRIRVGSGRRIERSLPPGATRADAQALEARLRQQIIGSATGQQRWQIDDALDRWVAGDAQHLKSWARDLRYRVEIIRTYTAGQPLAALPDVADRIKRKGQDAGTTAATINRYLSLLRRIGNLAERWGWTELPLGRRVVMLPEVSQRHVYLTPAQVKRLADHADPVVADLIWFAALTGLRRGELLRLRPEQARDGVLALDAVTKSGKPRGIPMPPAAAGIARRRLPWGLEYWELRDRFEAARKAAGMPQVQFRDLRHTYASWLVQRGQSLGAVRELMGHSSATVTQRYAHLAPEHLRRAVSVLDGLKVGKRR